VTGASSGFGYILTELALKNGEKVVATVRKPGVLSSLSAQYPDQLLELNLDVRYKEKVSAAFEKAKKHFGRIDIVFNNAGWSFVGEIEAADEDTARYIFEASHLRTSNRVACLM
jgi:NADP-dependent 3-hydroxy acid dehydrogenase YdfG